MSALPPKADIRTVWCGESIKSERLGSPYRSGHRTDLVKVKNLNAPAVKRAAEEDWGR